MSCGVIGGDARTFFMAGTNYTGIWDAPALAGTPGRPGFQPTVPVQIRFTIVFKVLRTRQSWSGTARVGWHTGCKPTVRPPVWRAVVRPARYFLSWQKVACGAFCETLPIFRRQKAWFLPAAQLRHVTVEPTLTCACGALGRRHFVDAQRTSISLAGQRCEAAHHRHERVEINRLRHV
jgi:hypothetical protein